MGTRLPHTTIKALLRLSTSLPPSPIKWRTLQSLSQGPWSQHSTPRHRVGGQLLHKAFTRKWMASYLMKAHSLYREVHMLTVISIHTINRLPLSSGLQSSPIKKDFLSENIKLPLTTKMHRTEGRKKLSYQ